MAKENIGLAFAAEKFGGKYFKNNGVLRAVIESPNTISDEAYTTLKKRWNENPDHSTPVLDRGMIYKPLGIAPEAAQFLQTRQFQIQEIARMFNVPLIFLMDNANSTYNNMEHQDLALAKYTIRPILKRDESELESKLLGDEWPDYNIKWNLDAMLRADIKSRSEYYAKMIQHRIMNPNEARELENMNPYDGGDKYENPNTISKDNNDGKDD